MSEAITREIRVEVDSLYVPARSVPHKSLYFFAYHVTIRNEGSVMVQLMTRHWTITDAAGRMEEVHGPGVVGAQPQIAPGQKFEYTSFCPLNTPMGSMRGTYQMVTEEGDQFDVTIAPFTLALPHAMN